jgi:serine/threonine-protein kinase
MQRYDKAGNLDLAITSLQNSIKTDPGFALGYAATGEAYRLKYQVEQDPRWLTEAQANCQKAAELDNRVPAVFVTLGQIHDLLGKHDLAVHEFQHALELDPKDAPALAGEAKSYESSGRIAEAEKTFQQAAALRPDNWYGFNDLGTFYERQAKYPQAVAAYQQALDLTPDNSEIYSNLAAAYIDTGGKANLTKAEEALKRSVALNPSYPAYANLGMLYMQEKRYADAATATERALQINGNNYLVWNNLMVAYEGAKEDGKAKAARQRGEQVAERVVSMKPQDAVAQSTLAVLYAQDKQSAKALAKCQTSLALAPDDPNVLSNVGEAYEYMGDRAQALEYVEKAIGKGYAAESITDDPGLQALVADPRFKAKFK